MGFKSRFLAAAAIFLFALVTAHGAGPALVLEDQHGVSHDPGKAIEAGSCIVIVGNAKDAAPLLVQWKNALGGSSMSALPVFLICNLGSVPFFVPKTTIIKKMKADYPSQSLLLDWKGEAVKNLAMGKDPVVVQLYRKGTLLATVQGPADDQKLGVLSGALR